MSLQQEQAYEMKTRKVIMTLFVELQKEIEALTDSDIKKLESGEFVLSLKVIKSANSLRELKTFTEQDSQRILDSLKDCKDRESGYEVLSSKVKTRKELEAFAKSINVHIMKQDNVDKVKEKIIEGVIGALLRSTAIQGK